MSSILVADQRWTVFLWFLASFNFLSSLRASETSFFALRRSFGVKIKTRRAWSMSEGKTDAWFAVTPCKHGLQNWQTEAAINWPLQILQMGGIMSEWNISGNGLRLIAGHIYAAARLMSGGFSRLIRGSFDLWKHLRLPWLAPSVVH